MKLLMRGCLAATLLLAPTFASPQIQAAIPRARLFCATTDGGGLGAALRIHGGPPWYNRLLGSTDGGRRMRQFGSQLYIVNSGNDTITRISKRGSIPQVYNIGGGGEPQDIHDPNPQAQFAPLAFVTRRNNPNLLRLNLVTGQSFDVLDLSPVGQGKPIALGTMERDGQHLFVQVRVFEDQESAVPVGDTGVLAVVDLQTLSLVDVEPLTPGIQGVALQGAPPHLKMQIIDSVRTLYVSTTDGLLDSRGGIEMVNLNTLTSTGYALSEQVTADMGGFVMTSPLGGFFVFHTDLLASTHLKRFTVLGGPDPGPEMIVLLGSQEEVIAYDPHQKRVYLPSGFTTATPGIYVFDAVTKLPIGSGPINTGMKPHDVLIAR